MDMDGNVWGWCADAYQFGFYAVAPQHNSFPRPALSFVGDDFMSIHDPPRATRGVMDESG